MLTKTFAAAVYGVDARLIDVEVLTGGELSPQTNMYNLVGLPDVAMKEGWQRIESAFKKHRL